MPAATITFTFDPYVRLGDVVIRLETAAVAGVALFTIIVAAVLAGRVRARDPDQAGTRDRAGPRLVWPGELPAGSTPPTREDVESATERSRRAGHLRRDDLLFIVVGIVPGAVLVGRALYGILYAGYYQATPGALLDPSQGSLSLSGAVVGGVLTGLIVAAVLDAPIGRWLTVAIGPVLLAIGLGKLAMVLGGSGQGRPYQGEWATAYAGPGPWGSLIPEIPSHPSQLYEGVATLGIASALLIVAFLLPKAGRFDGRLFWLGIAAWAGARAAIAGTWRNEAVWEGLNAEQLISSGLAAISVLLVVALVTGGFLRGRRYRGAAAAARPAVDSSSESPRRGAAGGSPNASAGESRNALSGTRPATAPGTPPGPPSGPQPAGTPPGTGLRRRG